MKSTDMECTCNLDNTMRIQQCWKMMIQGCEMLKFKSTVCGSTTPSKATQQKSNPKLTCHEMHANEGLETISCVSKKNSRQTDLHISSITSILVEERLPESFAEIQNLYSLTRCFSLISTHGDEGKCFNFVAPTAEVARCWTRGLQVLVQNRSSREQATKRRDEWLRDVFSKLKKNKGMTITYADIFMYLNSKRISITSEFFRDKMKEFLRKRKRKEKPQDSMLNEEEFVEFYKFVSTREEIENLFRRVSSNGAFVSADDLEFFLAKEQYITNVTQDNCKELISFFEVTQCGRDKAELGIDGFTAYLKSPDMELFNSAHEQVYQDMSQPIPHYYISSSHNTYLIGHQLRGYSSVQAYKDVLEKGVRCVELDCWDGDDGEPIVYHGHTLTTKIPFIDIIAGIKESAFKASPYPVIVSLENHCNEEVQRKMARYLVEILGDALSNKPVDSSLTSFPSPEFFKHKILIRGKQFIQDEFGNGNGTGMGEVNNMESGKGSVSQASSSSNKEKDNDGVKDISVLAPSQTSATNSSNLLSIASQSESGRSSPINRQSPQASPTSRRRKIRGSKSKTKVAKELSELINYISNAKFISFSNSAANGHFSHSSSFVESVMESHVRHNAMAFVDYNKRQLSRIYPGGLRIESSNYNPQIPWNVGCQIVALNHQTKSEPMHLHYGKFRQNGKSGYVLKPEFLRDQSIKFDPNSHDVAFPGIQSKHLRLTVISGQQFPTVADAWALVKDEPDPYVQVELHGVPADKFEFFTKGLNDSSFNPIWNDSFERLVLVPELAMVRFVVYDEDYGLDDFIGQATLPLDSMLLGYRHVQLLDMDNEPIPCAFLFIYVDISDVKMMSS